MLPEIARYVANLKTSPDRKVIGIALRPIYPGRMHIPLFVRSENRLRGKSLIIHKAKQQVAMCRDEIWFNKKCALEVNNCRIHNPLIFQNSAKIVVRLSELRFELHGPLILRYCFR